VANALRLVSGGASPRCAPALGPVLAWHCALRDLELAQARELDLLGRRLCCPLHDHQALLGLSDELRAAKAEIDRLARREKVERLRASGRRWLRVVGGRDAG